MENKIVAVWGSPSSGKTVTSMELARELETHKKNVIVIFADLFCPVLSTVMPGVDVKSRTLGSLLSKPHIKQIDIMQTAIPYPKHEYIAAIGYKNGDNIFTYSEFLAERVAELISGLRQAADCVIIDCSSVLTEDGFTTIALQQADTVLRLCNADLKAFSYFTSHLPLISRAKFKSDGHIKVLSNLKPGQEENTFRSVYGDVAYALPHVKEIETQFYSASLLDGLNGKDAKKYNAEVKRMVREVFGLE
jgi:MinD-like ATPase involved in chromosome partitioning or flagellar assembly